MFDNENKNKALKHDLFNQDYLLNSDNNEINTEIEDLKNQIITLFCNQKQKEINIKQNIKEDINEIIYKMEVISKNLESDF